MAQNLKSSNPIIFVLFFSGYPLTRVLKGKMGTGICSFSVLGIGIFRSFITGNNDGLKAFWAQGGV